MWSDFLFGIMLTIIVSDDTISYKWNCVNSGINENNFIKQEVLYYEKDINGSS